MRRNFSTKRQAIYDMLVSRKDHPSAKQIYESLKPSYPDLSLGTVYRNISLFKQEGMADSVCTLKGEERLDGNKKPHAHLICTECGSITDVFFDRLDVIEDKGEMEGFLTERKVISFYGKCRNCR
ncbi:MAG: transcriptional repressor [Ruminococcus sp.]|nr:transcriptional repressor [Ruminococcus sp.]